MPVRTTEHYDRGELRGHRDELFVFGDNLACRGLGGQAAECRGEPNAVGVPTKRYPARDENAYFRPEDFDVSRVVIDRAFDRLESHVKAGGTVVLPADGLGTGRAELRRRAPNIYEYILLRTARLWAAAETVNAAAAPQALRATIARPRGARKDIF